MSLTSEISETKTTTLLTFKPDDTQRHFAVSVLHQSGAFAVDPRAKRVVALIESEPQQNLHDVNAGTECLGDKFPFEALRRVLRNSI